MKRLPKPNEVRRQQGFEIMGIVWTRVGNMWQRVLFRRFRKSRVHDTATLIHIDHDDPDFCMTCLSQKIIHEVIGEHIWERCIVCGNGQRWIEAPAFELKRSPPGDYDLPPLEDGDGA